MGNQCLFLYCCVIAGEVIFIKWMLNSKQRSGLQILKNKL